MVASPSTSQPKHSAVLARLLDGASSLDEVEARMSSLSLEERKEILNETRKANARDSSVDYIEYVYSEHLTDGDGFLPEHIVEAIDFVEGCVRDRENGVGLEPRGSSKSTSITIGWLTKYIEDNPDIRVGLFSNTATQAEAFSRAIRTTIGENDKHHEIYGPPGTSRKWTDSEWIHPKSRHQKGSKDVTVYAQGTGGPIISKRFDIIICDDLLDEENTTSALQMEKVETWFWKTVKPCLVPGGVIIVIGTRWGEGDLYQKLIESKEEGGKGWRCLVKSALTEVDGELVSYWPARWPVSALLKEQEDMGSAFFACAYQNDISGLMKGNVFHRLADAYYFTHLPSDRQYTFKMGIDLASSEKERADFTARVISAVDTEGEFWVLSAYHDKREDHHAEFINDGYQAWPQINLVVCENNQFQSTLIKQVMQDFPAIPITGRKSDTDKTTRARAVAARYEAHKVHHHVSLKGSEFERELLSFPKGHDDFVDALGFSMDLGGNEFFFGTLRRGSRIRR